MKLIDMMDDQLQIMGKTPTKTSQHIIEVVTDSNTVPSTIENPPLIDVISTNYQLQQKKYNIESSNSDTSDVTSAASRNSSSITEQLDDQDCDSSQSTEHVAPWPRGPPPKPRMHAASDIDSASSENSYSHSSDSDDSIESNGSMESHDGSDSAGSSDTDGSDDQ